MKEKILLFDIETAPSLGYYFDPYKEFNILNTVTPWYMLSFSWKWLNEKKVNVLALPDFEEFASDKTDDSKLVKELWKLFNDADVLIAHHGDPFDVKKTNARFIKHGLTPPAPYKTIDTKKVAKRYFKFDSNKLDELGRYLGIGRKIKHTGIDLWLDCMNGDIKAWNMMKKYNKKDVVLLEKVYLKMRGWIKNHPNHNLPSHNKLVCPNCNSSHVQKRGFIVTRTATKQRFACMDCGAWSSVIGSDRKGTVLK